MRPRTLSRMSSHLSGAVILRVLCSAGMSASMLALNAAAQLTSPPSQSTQPPKETSFEGYSVHQSIDVGGRIANINGSEPMYDTLVNMQSGPRVLQQSMDMHALPGQAHFFLYDTLVLTNMGYGGDPINTTMLRMSKGKLYDFQGLFRRDREYFDYNLFGNPLIPDGVTSNGYTFPQVLHAAHLFNTVRRMTDTNLTLFPLSRLSFQAGYSQNINQGPTYSSLHNGAEAQLLQNWRNSTDLWFGVVNWKPWPKTVFTYQETVSHYKGDTNWQLTGPYLQLPNGGGPVTLGYDNVQLPSCNDGNAPIVNGATNPATVNPTCAGFQQLSRYAPTRTLFPTEEFRFQSSDIKNLQLNGRFKYTGAHMNLPNFNENFLGLDDFGIRSWNITGYAKGQRINVSADIGGLWQINPQFSISEQFDFWDFRQPAISYLSEIDHFDDANPNTPSMADPPGAAQPPSITSANNYLGQKLERNTFLVQWRANPRATFSIGYRYQSRTIHYVLPLSTDFWANGADYTVPIHTSGGLIGAVLHPTPQWAIDATVEGAWADAAYVQIDPRQYYRSHIRALWTPSSTITVTATFDDTEGRNNQLMVSHSDHNRAGAAGVEFTPGEHYAIALNYGYTEAYTHTSICYASSVAPPTTPAAPASCGTNVYLGTGYYNEPTNYGSIDFMYSPMHQLKAHAGFRVNSVNGSTEFLNPRQVPGSLQSQYYTPYTNVLWTIKNGFGFRGEYNYYGYGEGAPVGPTLPRAFHTNLFTLGAHYEF